MRVRTLLIPLTVAVAFVAGCTSSPGSADNGIAALSAQEIYDKALAALSKAASVHIVGSVDASNKVDVDYSAQKSAGTITINNAPVEVRIIGADAYVKAGPDFYTLLLGPTMGPAFAAQGAGKWYHGSTTDARLASALGLADPTALLSFDGAITKGATKDVDGQPAIGLVEEGPDGATLWVATTGEPLPLRVDGTAGGTLKITYNEAFTVEAPPAAEVVDVPAI